MIRPAIAVGFAMFIIGFVYTSASPVVAKDILYPAKHPIKFAYKCTFPIRHPLQAGKWMESSGFNGGLTGLGAAGSVLFSVSQFFLR